MPADITSGGDLGAVKIGGDVKGGTAILSGAISTSRQARERHHRRLAHRRHESMAAGKIFSSGDMGPVKIGRDVRRRHRATVPARSVASAHSRA